MVLSGAHGIYDVHTNEGVLRCTLRGKLKKAFAQAYSAKPVTKFRQSQQRANNVLSSLSTVVPNVSRNVIAAKFLFRRVYQSAIM